MGVAGFSTTPGRRPGPDEAQRAVEMGAGLLVDQDVVAAGLDELGSILVGIGDHQVHIELQPGGLAEGLDHRESDTDVGDEVSVHDIDVQHRGSGALDFRDVVAQVREIGRQDGGKDFDHVYDVIERC